MIESRLLSATRLDETSLVSGRRSSTGAEPAPLRGSRGRPRTAPVILPGLPTPSRSISRFIRASPELILEGVRETLSKSLQIGDGLKWRRLPA